VRVSADGGDALDKEEQRNYQRLRLGRPLRNIYKRAQLLEEWQHIQARPPSARVQRLDRTNETETATALDRALADANERAVQSDWETLQLECGYLNAADQARVHDALRVAHGAHAGQQRRSGEPFIVHPVAVARLLAGLGMDRETVVAGLLHDTVEDTALTFEDVERRYGADVRGIVEGETKVSKLPKLGLPREADADDFAAYESLRLGEAEADAARGGGETPKELEQLENLRQMFVAMTDDYRIIVVKLADRLHNMRTLEHMPTHKQLKIARETLEIFAPLAHRLGIWQFKAELEEIAFRYVHPRPAFALRKAIESRARRYDGARNGVTRTLESKLRADDALDGVEVTVSGRTKELYSLWLKMERDRRRRRDELCAEVFGDVPAPPPPPAAAPLFAAHDLDAVQDVVAVRVILDVPRGAAEDIAAWRERSVDLCYHVLGQVRNLEGCSAVPRVKDYIAFPKPNGYQSLHASVNRVPENQVVEIQIRTRWMHEIAEHGMAAHWLYKDGLLAEDPTGRRRVRGFEGGAANLGAVDVDRGPAKMPPKPYAVSWLNAIKDWQHEIHSSKEFIETIRRELLGKRVFVFLRDGRILDLSRGATVLDAAFQIHTDVGLKCDRALINGREVQLSYELQNGDVVSIVTDDDAQPQFEWLRMAQRRSTRSKLRAYFKGESLAYEDRKRALADEIQPPG